MPSRSLYRPLTAAEILLVHTGILVVALAVKWLAYVLISYYEEMAELDLELESIKERKGKKCIYIAPLL